MTFVNFMRTTYAAFLKWRIHRMMVRIEIDGIKIDKLMKDIKEEL